MLIKRVPEIVCHPMLLSLGHQAYSDRTDLLCITSPVALYFRPNCERNIILKIFMIANYLSRNKFKLIWNALYNNDTMSDFTWCLKT